jgi:hypothetical protein
LEGKNVPKSFTAILQETVRFTIRIVKRKTRLSDWALRTKRIVARISIFSHRGIYISKGKHNYMGEQ